MLEVQIAALTGATAKQTAYAAAIRQSSLAIDGLAKSLQSESGRIDAFFKEAQADILLSVEIDPNFNAADGALILAQVREKVERQRQELLDKILAAEQEQTAKLKAELEQRLSNEREFQLRKIEALRTVDVSAADRQQKILEREDLRKQLKNNLIDKETFKLEEAALDKKYRQLALDRDKAAQDEQNRLADQAIAYQRKIAAALTVIDPREGEAKRFEVATKELDAQLDRSEISTYAHYIFMQAEAKKNVQQLKAIDDQEAANLRSRIDELNAYRDTIISAQITINPAEGEAARYEEESKRLIASYAASGKAVEDRDKLLLALAIQYRDRLVDIKQSETAALKAISDQRLADEKSLTDRLIAAQIAIDKVQGGVGGEVARYEEARKQLFSEYGTIIKDRQDFLTLLAALEIEHNANMEAIQNERLKVERKSWDDLSDPERRNFVATVSDQLLTSARKNVRAYEQLNDSMTDAEREAAIRSNEINKKRFEQNKKISIAQALISTFTAAAGALEAYKGFAGVAAAAAITAVGFANVRNIRSTTFGSTSVGASGGGNVSESPLLPNTPLDETSNPYGQIIILNGMFATTDTDTIVQSAFKRMSDAGYATDADGRRFDTRAITTTTVNVS